MRIEENNNRLRIRFGYNQQSFCLYLGLAVSRYNYLRAERIKALIESDIQKGQFVAEKLEQYKLEAPYLSAMNLLELWLAEKNNYLDPLTIDWYRQGTLKSFQDYFGLEQSTLLTPEQCYDFMGWLLQLGRAPETQKRKLESLKACWDWGLERGHVFDNPWTNLPELIKVPKQPPHPFSTLEIQTIVAGFEAHQHYCQLTPFVKFLFNTGCRMGEVIGLRWQHVSHNCQTVTICEQVGKKKRRKPRTKTGKYRTLSLSNSLTQLLLELQPLQPDPLDAVFLWNGAIINSHNFRQRPWKKILNLVEVTYRPPSHTRHTFVTHQLERGVNPTIIAQQTGHSVKVLLEHYAGYLSSPQLPELC